MRFGILLSFFLLLFKFCDSQDTAKSSSLRPKYLAYLTAGASSSFGLYSFDEETGDYSTGAFAAQGVVVKVNFDYPLKKRKLELTGTMGYNHNAYDIANFSSFEYLRNGETITHANATGYDMFSFLPGVKYPFGKRKFTFYVEAMVGVLVFRTPYISYTATATSANGYTNTSNITQASGTGLSAAINFGVGIIYHLDQNKFIMLTANSFSNDFHGAPPSIFVTTTARGNSGTYSQDTYLSVPIYILSVELGVGLEF